MFRRFRSCWVVLAAVVSAGLLLAGGCATSDAESDLPWNMTQPWESSPGIPGMNN